jgi:hypothetical protein
MLLPVWDVIAIYKSQYLLAVGFIALVGGSNWANGLHTTGRHDLSLSRCNFCRLRGKKQSPSNKRVTKTATIA